MMPTSTYRVPGTPKSLKIPSKIPSGHGNFSHFMTIFRSKYPFLTPAQIRRRARKEWRKREGDASSLPSTPEFRSHSTEVYNFDNYSSVASPNLFSPERDWKCQTYSKSAKIAPKKTPPQIMHLTSSSQVGILKTSHKSANNKSRVSFGETDRYFFTPRNSSSESATMDQKGASDVYDFVADTRQITEYDSDEDRMQQLDVLHHNVSQEKSTTADDEWEKIKKVPKTRKIAELSSQSPSTKVIQWMNQDFDPYDLENENPSPPSTPRSNENERYLLRSNRSPLNEQNEMLTPKRSKQTLKKQSKGEDESENREQELLRALSEVSFLPTPKSVNSQESLPLSSDLVEMFLDSPPEALTPGRRFLASSQIETESNFHSLFEDEGIFH